jgi:hypothetical protein
MEQTSANYAVHRKRLDPTSGVAAGAGRLVTPPFHMGEINQHCSPPFVPPLYLLALLRNITAGNSKWNLNYAAFEQIRLNLRRN